MMITADRALFIKLGEKGFWEEECIRNGTLRLSYSEVPHEPCIQGRWDEVVIPAKSKGASASHKTQMRYFYTEPSTTLWVTFYADKLWWCFADEQIEFVESDLSKVRRAIGGWKGVNINQSPLLIDRLNGHLVAVRGYQGTICNVPNVPYLLHKINGTLPDSIAKATSSFNDFVENTQTLLKSLHPKDFEVLIDLIYRQGGLNRVSVLGETEKDIDLALVHPITGDRVAVQVKSKAEIADLTRFVEYSKSATGFNAFYFVTHTHKISASQIASLPKSMTFWGGSDIAKKTVELGLVRWLMDKAA